MQSARKAKGKEILAKMIERQSRLGMGNLPFAKHIGVNRTTWVLTKNGHVAMGPTIARAGMRAFPELTPDVVSFLLMDVTVLTENVSSGSTARLAS